MQQKTERSIRAGVHRLCSVLIGPAFRLLLSRGNTKILKVLKFVGKQNAVHTQWFLHAADQFLPDEERTHLNEDKQTVSPNVHLHRSASSSFRKERDTTRQSSYRYPESFHQQKEEQKQEENVNRQWQSFNKGSLPLWAAEQTNLSDQEQEEEVVNRMRQRKTRRDQFKNKFIEAQKSGTFRQDIKFDGARLLKQKKKGDKLLSAQHYIDMEIQIKQPENASETTRLKRTHRKYMSSDEKFNTKNKTSIPGFALAKQKYETLKPEERVFILQIPNQMKLTSGVTHRETSQRINNIDTFCLSNPTKKRLQFLKNNELNPCKIKLSELMSYKKLGTMTNLAYCSSMKTVKDIGKEPAQSKISIDSRQLIDQPGSSKKLIRIANRRIFEELMFEGNEENSGEIGWKKSRVKLKKQNKVRFDNIVAN